MTYISKTRFFPSLGFVQDTANKNFHNRTDSLLKLMMKVFKIFKKPYQFLGLTNFIEKVWLCPVLPDTTLYQLLAPHQNSEKKLKIQF